MKRRGTEDLFKAEDYELLFACLSVFGVLCGAALVLGLAFRLFRIAAGLA